MITEITLRRSNNGDWRLFAPKGHQMGGPFHGTESAALAWGRAFLSCWLDMIIKVESQQDPELKGEYDETSDRLLE